MYGFAMGVAGGTMASFKCADIGMACGFEVKGAKDADEVMAIAAAHARSTHGISSPPPDLVTKLKHAIRA
jgi:predicted small metal-binding protein